MKVEISNLVVITGKIISEPKSGLSNKGSLNTQFVVASPKNKFFDLNNCNYIPCIMWDKIAKEFPVDNGLWVKLSGKLNTFKLNKENKFQIVIESLQILDVD